VSLCSEFISSDVDKTGAVHIILQMPFEHEKGCGGYMLQNSELDVVERSASLSSQFIRDEKAPDIH
jgi:hypothetical protein